MRSAKDVIHGIALLAVVLAVYVPSLSFSFTYDDHYYIEYNSHMRGGLTLENAGWACTTYYFSNWHPLTWWSYMLDTSVFGRVPWGYRLVNICLHLVNTALVFLVTHELTKRKGLAWWMAGVFALHPLHIESVVWISSRKDVLSILFGLSAMLAYFRYVQQPTRGRYWTILGLLVLSLLAKQTLITFPCLMLLLDIWPLNRLKLWEPGWPVRLRKLVIEKLPMFGLSIFFGIAVINAQTEGGALMADVDTSVKLINAVNAISTYITQIFWPVGLCPFYPHLFDRLTVDVWFIARAVLLGVICAIALSALLVRRFTDIAYLGTGWYWFLGTLIPMAGLIQLGSASHADRYMYFPLIGFSLLIGIFACRLEEVLHASLKRLIPAAMYASLVLMALASMQQIPYWQNDIILFRRALSLTPDNMPSRVNLSDGLITRAKELIESGREEDAIDLLVEGRLHSQIARRIQIIPAVFHNLVTSSTLLKQYDRAEEYGRSAVKRYPEHAGMWYNLGEVYREMGDAQQAEECFLEALVHRPKHVEAMNRLAYLNATSDPMQAEEWCRKALEIDPLHVEARTNLGNALTRQGRLREAIAEYRYALSLDPGNVRIQENLEIARNMARSHVP